MNYPQDIFGNKHCISPKISSPVHEKINVKIIAVSRHISILRWRTVAIFIRKHFAEPK